MTSTQTYQLSSNSPYHRTDCRSADNDGTTKAPASKGGKKRAVSDDDDGDEKPVKKSSKRGKATDKAKVEDDNEDDADVGAVIKSEASEEAEE